MKDINKMTASRWLIFVSFTLALFMKMITSLYPEIEAFNPDSLIMAAIGLFICVLLLAGLYFGSRGLGEPLTVGLFLKLIFSEPNRYIFVPYLLLGAAGILYLELSF